MWPLTPSPTPVTPPPRPEIIGILNGSSLSDDPSTVLRLAHVSQQAQRPAAAPSGDPRPPPEAGASASTRWSGCSDGPSAPPEGLFCSPSLSSPFYYEIDPITMEMTKQRFSDGIKFDWGVFTVEPDPADPGSYLCAGTRWGEGYILYSLKLGLDGAHL